MEAVLRFGATIGCEREHHRALASGFARLKQLIRRQEEEGASLTSGYVVSAGQLTTARGRFSRSWHAPAGGVWLTMALANTLTPAFARLLPLAAGLACCECVRAYGVDARIRWVNDVHLAGRKIAGILTESHGHGGGEEYLLVGMGINANNNDFPSEIAAASASMAGLLGRFVDLEEVVTLLLVKLVWNIGLLFYDEQRSLEESHPEAGRMPRILSSYERLCDSVGRTVRFGFDLEKKTLCTARALCLTKKGELVLRLPDGSTLTESAGEIRYLDIA